MITGRGWGHGVGMPQWGAYGYAQHGFTYNKILAHFYPGTTLTVAPVARIKVLLVDSIRKIVLSSQDPFTVVDGDGIRHQIAGGNYPLTPALKVKLGPDAPAEALPGPLRFVAGTSPLWLAHPWRGDLIVAANGKSLSVVNDVPLDSYTRGVVSNEMPKDWPLEAVKAQAVAARSYALAHKRGAAFVVYADTRDQVYGGITTETPVGDQAVAATRRQVLMYDGKVATTYFYSSSGGMTASIADVFAGSKPVPYLVSVPDPYDTASPWHSWGPVVISAATAGRQLGVSGLLALRPVPATGRPRYVVAIGRDGDVPLRGGDIRRASAFAPAGSGSASCSSHGRPAPSPPAPRSCSAAAPSWSRASRSSCALPAAPGRPARRSRSAPTRRSRSRSLRPRRPSTGWRPAP